MADLNLKNFYLETKRALFDKYYENLNEMQRKAVYCVNGPLLILAGAGSGKTTVLVNRIAYLIRYGNAYNSDKVPAGITEEEIAEMKKFIELPKEELGDYLTRFTEGAPEPWQVMAITFTNKAAREIKTRLEKVFGEGSPEIKGITAGTFHSVCVRILRRYGDRVGYGAAFTICDSDDSKKQIGLCMKNLGIDDSILPVKSVQNAISRAKDKLIGPEEYYAQNSNDAKYSMIAKVYAAYAEALKTQNLLDFDDLIMQTVLLLRNHDDVLKTLQNKFKYISVDEFQDTNEAQLELTKMLSAKHKNIMVVGDDDQSIYKFRGAVIENILNFDKMFKNTEIIKLEDNYRSSGNILRAANSVIRENTQRKGKVLRPTKDDGEKVILKQVSDQNDEGRFIASSIISSVRRENKRFGDFAVLYRVNAQSRAIEQAFTNYNIPYIMLGGLRFFDRAEIKDMVAYLAVINNQNDDLRLRRIINTPRRGIGDKSLQIAEALAASENCPMFEFLRGAKRYSALSAATSNQMVNFVFMIDSLVEKASTLSVSALLKEVYERTGYKRMLENIDDKKEREERISNVEELVSAAVQYERENEDASLAGFLEDVALVADVDKYDESADAVVMMTIHSAKGLEFNEVFLPGLEEELFPSGQSLREGNEEEERRLAYVAITRARRKLYLIHAESRLINGFTNKNPVSRFVKSIEQNDEDCLYDETKVAAVSAPKVIHPRYPKAKPVNNFVNETSKRSPALKEKTNNEEKHSGLVPLHSGDKVKHIAFGEGVVMSVNNMGGDQLVEVAFEKVGTKKLMRKFAKLEKI